MSSNNLVICDPETDYASRLAAYLSGKRELAFQVKICSSPEQLRLVCGELPTALLLLNEVFAREEIEEIYKGAGSVRIIILSDREEDSDGSDKTDRIYKYQSGEEIYMQIIQICAAENMDGFWRVRKKEKGRIIGVYSPVHRVGQTDFAIQKGKELAKEENVLYINLETYAGFGGYFPEEREKTLAVLLYYAKQESGNPGLILTTLVRQMEGMDYVPPVVFPEDLKALEAKEWIWLFREILQNSIYDVLILDLGECVNGLYEILRFCDTVYMPVADDRVAAAKITQYEEILRQLGYGEVAERMIRCDIRRTIAGKDSGQAGSVERNRR